MKLSENTSKHFAHRAFEVWSALYPDKPFGSKNKNTISYFMAAMLYTELELKRKVDWRIPLTRNKGDRMEYAKRNMHDNFNAIQQNVGVGLMPDAHGDMQNTSRSTKIV